MSNPRFSALREVQKNQQNAPKVPCSSTSSEQFGIHVFNRNVMRKMLPRQVFENIMDAYEGRDKIHPDYADTIAVAMKEWAIELGATHYCHWFQPLTGSAAEKHDAFINWETPYQVVEKFSGKELIQGEPDASSFPSGGLRSTYEARGYTGWDPTSPAFVWKAGDGVTLCIPSVFFSWTGEVLDDKIPLHRSEEKLNDAVMRLLHLTGIEASRVGAYLGLEQEYFVVDRALQVLRPDLVLAGRTVFGAASPKGQELQDHYFGSVKNRVLRYMRDFEDEALKLAIPVKTRHNEVAPGQYEVAPVFEKASRAVDHNILLMELMRRIAVKHRFACLLHEKPYAGLNGSGKHCNWSVMTDTGVNLLDPTETPENNLHFLILLTAIMKGIHDHPALLRASIGSAGNDHRLGGHEAPPAIICIYLGEDLEAVLEDIEKKGSHIRSRKKGKYNLGLPGIAELKQDTTDRNRTSPFAFTGNKFEFRAVGSSQNPSMPVTVLNVVVAESLNSILDAIEKGLGGKRPKSNEELLNCVMPVLQKFLKQSRNIRFTGDNYSEQWAKEASRRKIPNIKKSVEAFEALIAKKTVAAFEGVLSLGELQARYEVMLDHYAQTVLIEARLMIELFRTQVLPAALTQQKRLAKSLSLCEGLVKGKKATQNQRALLEELVQLIEQALSQVDALEALTAAIEKQASGLAQAKKCCEQLLKKGEALRTTVDLLEHRIDDALWPLPKYRELMFIF